MVDSCHTTSHKKIVNAGGFRDFTSLNETTNREDTVPYIKIIEQPAPKALRFRYECEGRSAGSIPGLNSTPENKTYPAIQIVGYKGRAVIVVSCVTKDPPYRPHPHNLVGKEGCKKGICTLELNNDSMIASFSNLGIQCVKKKDIEDALKVREEIRVDPFRTGFAHRSQVNSIDLNAVRLCFQAFLDGSERGKFDVLTPIVSEPIYDKKAMSDLCICKLSDTNASVIGGKEMILLCEKVGKDDIQVRFYEESAGQVVWDGYGDFTPAQVHKQVAIAFRTPRYKTIQVEGAVNVFIQLRRPSDGATSESLPFFLTPLDTEPGFMKRKRQKFSSDNELLRHLQEFSSIHMESQYNQQQPHHRASPSHVTSSNAVAASISTSSPVTTIPITTNNNSNSYMLNSKFPANVYGSRTPSPLDYQQSGFNNSSPAAGGGISHMSGGTMLCTNNYLPPIIPSNTLPSIPPLPSFKQTGIGSVMSGMMNNKNVVDFQTHMQRSQMLPSENIGGSLSIFSHNYNATASENNGNQDEIQLPLKEEIDGNIMNIDNQQCSSMELSLSRLDSKDLVELSMLDAGNLSENLSNCLTLSDSKPLYSSKANGESMTDSLTKLTSNTLNDLCTLNKL